MPNKSSNCNSKPKVSSKSPATLKSSATFSEFKGGMTETEIRNYLSHDSSPPLYPERNNPKVTFHLTTSQGSLTDKENKGPDIYGKDCFRQ